MTQVDLPDQGPDGEAWRALCQLARAMGPDPETGRDRWTLIGGRMVEFHGREHGRAAPRASADLDVLANARLTASRPRDIAAWLLAEGFALEGVNPMGVGHRFRRGAAAVDVLAPRGVAPGTLEIVPGVRTVAVPGGTSALRASERVRVRCGEVVTDIPRPHLAAAVVAKVRAVWVDDAPEAQRIDAAFLCSLIADPLEEAARLRPADRRVLAGDAALLDAHHPAWRAAGDRAGDAACAFRLLAGR